MMVFTKATQVAMNSSPEDQVWGIGRTPPVLISVNPLPGKVLLTSLSIYPTVASAFAALPEETHTVAVATNEAPMRAMVRARGLSAAPPLRGIFEAELLLSDDLDLELVRRFDLLIKSTAANALMFQDGLQLITY